MTCFGVIQNNIALKHLRHHRSSSELFWSHTKQHSSKTCWRNLDPKLRFWSHTKQHSSKTRKGKKMSQSEFWSHTKQHSSKTHALLSSL